MGKTFKQTSFRPARKEKAEARRETGRRFRHEVKALVRNYGFDEEEEDLVLPLPPKTEGWETW